jgi:formate--tetrahydrofolate ligase
MKSTVKDISLIAKKLKIRENELEKTGRFKAKVNLSILERLPKEHRNKYILVSAITPTPFGEGKTVTTIALSMALNKLNLRSACTLRQSSLGPLFGAKGGATGGGASSVLPSEDINLHFTGDMHAVAAANNLLVSFLENSIFHGNKLGIQPESITFKRCLDVSDRSLRHLEYILKSGEKKYEMRTGFEITAASEVMSLLTLSWDFKDLRKRLRTITVARTDAANLVKAGDLMADGVMVALLKDAIKPNLVQTSEHTPCFIHSGPFANISIGSSSIISDRMALGLSDYVVTESGFGADCGAEKFFDIKCRTSGFKPDACVLVCSVRGLKAQSEKLPITASEKLDESFTKEDLFALEEGSVNLKKQIENVLLFKIPVFVCINSFSTDTKKEIDFIRKKAFEFGACDCQVSTAFKDGSRGILGLAKSVVKATRTKTSAFRFLYEDERSPYEKIEMIARNIYGAKDVVYTPKARRDLDFYIQKGFKEFPVCIAKTQFSLSHDEALKGAPKNFDLPIKDVQLCSGAGFILAHASTMQTMPGLPLHPRGANVDVDSFGAVSGLV